MSKGTCTVDGCEKPLRSTFAEWCAMHYHRHYRTGSLDLIPRDRLPDLCSVAECFKPRRTKGGLCGMHNERARKFGDVNAYKYAKRRRVDAAGYVKVFAPSHLLADGNGYVGRNRVMLWGAIGGDAHPCHWCGTTVRWFAEWGKDRDCLVADHLNGVRHDDRPWNLVPSCIACNVSREAAGK